MIALDPNADQATSNTRILAPVKTNLVPKSDSLSFTIDDGKVKIISWGDTIDANILIRGERDAKSPSKVEQAKELLKQALSDEPVEKLVLVELAKEYGISEETLINAKERLRVESFKEKKPRGSWLWKLKQFNENISLK